MSVLFGDFTVTLEGLQLCFRRFKVTLHALNTYDALYPGFFLCLSWDSFPATEFYISWDYLKLFIYLIYNKMTKLQLHQ